MLLTALFAATAAMAPLFAPQNCHCAVRAVCDVRIIEGTEAKFSPDGRRILFQRDAGKRSCHVGILDLGSGSVEWVCRNGGIACHPAWGPDGSVIYTYGEERMTAFAARTAKSEDGYNLRLWRNGSELALTRRRNLDYAASYSPDTGRIYFTSTAIPRKNSRGTELYDRVGLLSMEPKDGAATRLEFLPDTYNSGIVSASASPDGRTMLFAERPSFWKPWRISTARIGARGLEAVSPLTPETMAAYSPAWSPDGGMIAFTGYGPDDDGWYVYMMKTDGSGISRFAKGRNPSFAPDGGSIAFDDGKYIYRRPLK